MEAGVDDLLLNNDVKSNTSTNTHLCNGVVLDDGRTVHGKTVVLTTGTFLRAVINVGNETQEAGRMGDRAAVALAQTLDKLNFRLSRLKTGTPARIKKDSVDFKRCVVQQPDNPIEPFSYMSDRVKIDVSFMFNSHSSIEGRRAFHLFIFRL